MAHQNVETGADVVERGQELVDVIVDEEFFELGDEDRARVRVEQLDNSARFIEFLLDHKATDDLGQALAAEVIKLSVDVEQRSDFRLAKLAVPGPISVKNLQLAVHHVLLLMQQLELGKFLPGRNSVRASVFRNAA